jgi:predicted nucleotidyltransferase
MKEKFDELVSRLKRSHGDELISVILHGSTVVLGNAARPSDYRVMVIMATLDARALRQTQEAARWWLAEGFLLPVYFTMGELTASLDVFPIEFRQMKRAYRVLYGKDILQGAEISGTSLRWQIEHELRGKMLRLRALYLPLSESSDGLMKLMTDSIVSFVQLLRPLIELLGGPAPLERQEVIEQAGERLNIDAAPLQRVLKLRNEATQLMELEVQDLFSDYLNCLSQIIAAVDKHR